MVRPTCAPHLPAIAADSKALKADASGNFYLRHSTVEPEAAPKSFKPQGKQPPPEVVRQTSKAAAAVIGIQLEGEELEQYLGRRVQLLRRAARWVAGDVFTVTGNSKTAWYIAPEASQTGTSPQTGTLTVLKEREGDQWSWAELAPAVEKSDSAELNGNGEQADGSTWGMAGKKHGMDAASEDEPSWKRRRTVTADREADSDRKPRGWREAVAMARERGWREPGTRGKQSAWSMLLQHLKRLCKKCRNIQYCEEFPDGTIFGDFATRYAKDGKFRFNMQEIGVDERFCPFNYDEIKDYTIETLADYALQFPESGEQWDAWCNRQDQRKAEKAKAEGGSARPSRAGHPLEQRRY